MKAIDILKLFEDGSYVQNNRKPREGDEVWFLSGQFASKPLKGKVIRIDTVERSGWVYVSIVSDGKEYRTNLAEVFDHKPKLVEVTDEFGTTKVWK